MNIEHEYVRNRIVKGWAFRNISDEDVAAIRRFLASGDTDELPAEYQRESYEVYEKPVPHGYRRRRQT